MVVDSRPMMAILHEMIGSDERGGNPGTLCVTWETKNRPRLQDSNGRFEFQIPNPVRQRSYAFHLDVANVMHATMMNR